MRIAWCIAVLAGCYTSTPVKPVAPLEPVEPPVQVDERPAPDRTYRRTEMARPSCGDDDASFECVLVTFTTFRDRACDCSAGDKVCADAVIADMTTWSQNVAVAFTKANHTPTPEQTKLLTDVSTDFSKCLATAMTPPARPPTP